MTAFDRDLPRWPAAAGVVAIVASPVVAILATLAVAAIAVLAGAQGSALGPRLGVSVLTAAGMLAAVLALARLTAPPSASQFGLRAPRAPARAVLLTLGAAALLGLIVCAAGGR